MPDTVSERPSILKSRVRMLLQMEEFHPDPEAKRLSMYLLARFQELYGVTCAEDLLDFVDPPPQKPTPPAIYKFKPGLPIDRGDWILVVAIFGFVVAFTVAMIVANR